MEPLENDLEKVEESIETEEKLTLPDGFEDITQKELIEALTKFRKTKSKKLKNSQAQASFTKNSFANSNNSKQASFNGVSEPTSPSRHNSVRRSPFYINQLKHGKKVSPTRLQEDSKVKRTASPNGYTETS